MHQVQCHIDKVGSGGGVQYEAFVSKVPEIGDSLRYTDDEGRLIGVVHFIEYSTVVRNEKSHTEIHVYAK